MMHNNLDQTEKKTLYIIDLSNFIFRAFYAIGKLTTPTGVPVNALHGVLSMLLKILLDKKPTHLLIARDTKAKSWRSEIFKDYKSNRSAPPDDLIPQFALIDEAIEVLALSQWKKEGLEADDLIATSVHHFSSMMDEVVIVTGDKDMFQLVTDRVKVWDTMKDVWYGPLEVKNKMGVRPDQIVDFLAIKGDSSDFIPGVKGIGEKGAVSLLSEFDHLEDIYEQLHELSSLKLKKSLETYQSDALMSKKLAQTLVVEPLTSLDDCHYDFKIAKEFLDFLKKYHLKALYAKYAPHLIPATTQTKSEVKTEVESEVKTEQQKDSFPINTTLSFLNSLSDESHSSPNTQAQAQDILSVPLPQITLQELTSLLEVKDKSYVTQFYFFSSETNKNYTIFSFTHEHFSHASFDEIRKKQIELSNYVVELVLSSEEKTIFSTLLANELLRTISLITPSFKALAHYLKIDASHMSLILEKCDHYSTQHPIKNLSLHDLSLMKFLLNSDHEILMSGWLVDDSAGIDLNVIKALSVEASQLENNLKETNLISTYYAHELTLACVLYQMEERGIELNANELTKLTELWQKQSLEITTQMNASIEGHGLTEINFNSPKQIAELLYEKLMFPIIKKNKTGPSTDASVLQSLAAMKLHPFPELLLSRRELEKLISTYSMSLAKYIASDGRLHTTYHQTVAATGRLSSDSPNMQNIPIKTERGRLLRKAFKAKKGYQLLSADYSQIELRLLAHYSNDPVMVSSFREGIDIHAQTASEIFQVPLSEVSDDLRSKAKAINFGLLYGQSSFGLSEQLKISRQDAKNYITFYFERFGHVKSYLDKSTELATKLGYACTHLGRRRWLSDLTAENKQAQSRAQRMAINTPIQGTAADIIKLAMIKLEKDLRALGLKAQLLLQVHDELVLEVDPSDFKKVSALVKDSMEGVMKLSVPLIVDCMVGENWLEMDSVEI